jgi:hypothetical protein
MLGKVVFYFTEKIQVIYPAEKDLFPVIASVVDMVKMVRY